MRDRPDECCLGRGPGLGRGGFREDLAEAASGGPQLWVMNADGTDQTQLTCSTQGTCPVPLGGINLLAHWGELRVLVKQ